MANNIIQKIQFGSTSYDIDAVSARNVPASGVQGDLAWGNISALATTTTADMTSTELIVTPSIVSAYVKSKVDAAVAGVYTVKGPKSCTEINALTDMVKGDVYNVTDNGTIGTESILAGDNVVYDGEKWDKLAASVSLEGYATETYVNTAISTATSAQAAALWSEVTGYVDGKVANASNWDSAFESITGAVATSAGMADTANTGKLAQVGAITGYIEDKISETIAETIDIAETITTDTPTSAIPNVGALTGYVNTQYIEKTDITYEPDTQTLVINNV